MAEAEKAAEGGGGKKEDEKKKRSDDIKASIEAQKKRQEEERRREVMRKTIDLAKEGAEAHKRNQFGIAIRNFRTVVRMVELWKRVGDRPLRPTDFPDKRDTMFLLMLSGVFWDLARIMDLSRSAKKKPEFLKAMEIYIAFTKDKSYTPVAAETLRKYIYNNKPIHMKEFRQAYKTITGKNADSKCFMVTAMEPLTHPATLGHMRAYRDEVLLDRTWGRALVWVYYRVGPGLAWMAERMPMPLQRGLARFFDGLALRVSSARPRPRR